MNPVYRFETPLGKLGVEIDSHDQYRKIAFKKSALTISNVNISAIGYYLEYQTHLSAYATSSFEKYLLSEPHSFKLTDVNGIVEKFNLDKYFPNELTRIAFFLDNSSDIWFAVSQLVAKENAFTMELWDENTKDLAPSYSWKITVGADKSPLVKALECVCLLTDAIHNKKLSWFISKMALLYGY